jgi:hypothetical protein
MKRKILFGTFLLTAGGIIFFNGCSKDSKSDTTGPVITLNGNSSVDVVLNSSYTDAGATASDAEDGAVSVTTSNPVNVDSAATYTVTYNATDAAGNSSTASRTVIVANSAAYLEGNYMIIEDATDTFYHAISASKTQNNRIFFSKFGDYSSNSNIHADVSGSQVNLGTAQIAANIGAHGCTHTFTQNGNGNSIVTVASKSTFSVKYFDMEDLGGVNCPGYPNTPYEDVYVQQ